MQTRVLRVINSNTEDSVTLKKIYGDRNPIFYESKP